MALIDRMREEWASMTDEPKPNRDQIEFVALLARHEARALIVGAHALAFHARPRYTKELDIFIEASAENAAKVVAVIQEVGFASLGITVGDLTTPGQIIQLGLPPNRIDLMTNITGVTFAEGWEPRVEGKLGEQTVSFIGKAELMRNKSATGRHQDLADLEGLRRS